MKFLSVFWWFSRILVLLKNSFKYSIISDEESEDDIPHHFFDVKEYKVKTGKSKGLKKYLATLFVPPHTFKVSFHELFSQMSHSNFFMNFFRKCHIQTFHELFRGRLTLLLKDVKQLLLAPSVSWMVIMSMPRLSKP